MDDQRTSRSRLRPRISLLTAILLTTIVGLSIVMIRHWWELAPLRAEVRQLRDEAGKLSIDDPAKIHAIQVQTYNDLAWKWRVWVPKGESVKVNYLWGMIPRSGYPQSQGSATLEAGENWVTLQASPSVSGGGWETNLKTERDAGDVVMHGGHGSSIPDDVVWFDEKGPKGTFFYGEEVGHSSSAERERGKTFLLMRKRVLKFDGVPGPDDDHQPLPGLLIWLERP